MSGLLITALSNGVPIAAVLLGFFRPLDGSINPTRIQTQYFVLTVLSHIASKLVGSLLTVGGLYGWSNPLRRNFTLDSHEHVMARG
jgi:hypothetical protein